MAISIHALREEGDPVHAARVAKLLISIHALREEGDVAGRFENCKQSGISIHALREEGDFPSKSFSNSLRNFYPRPP